MLQTALSSLKLSLAVWTDRGTLMRVKMEMLKEASEGKTEKKPVTQAQIMDRR
jgi:hypothetical protein